MNFCFMYISVYVGGNRFLLVTVNCFSITNIIANLTPVNCRLVADW